jgi:hypothetical protein
MDLSDTIKPQSAQLNADDLIAGSKTIKITSVKPGPNDKQKVAISYEGDEGRPYLPCLSMRRVLVGAWDTDSTVYIGRRITLFRDPTVPFKGVKAGGIRISHMTDLPGPKLEIILTKTRGERMIYTVLLLEDDPPPARPAVAPVPAQPTPAPVAPPPAGAPPEPARRRIIPTSGTSAPAAPVRRIATTPESP